MNNFAGVSIGEYLVFLKTLACNTLKKSENFIFYRLRQQSMNNFAGVSIGKYLVFLKTLAL